jgi:hypothetical protein
MSIAHDEDESLLEEVLHLEALLISYATGGAAKDAEYQALRQSLVHNITRDKLPDFVRRCRDLSQFWAVIRDKYPTYKERREFIRESFRPLLDELELADRSGAITPISKALEAFDPDQVHLIWQKATSRTTSDPEGAITAARTLLETVCKYILDDCNVTYPDDADLPKLWALAAAELNLAPQQHDEKVFKAILGNVQSVVNYVGTIRNRLGDAHGRGRKPTKPKPRHAELVVNLAGAMATFLIATWRDRD